MGYLQHHVIETKSCGDYESIHFCRSYLQKLFLRWLTDGVFRTTEWASTPVPVKANELVSRGKATSRDKQGGRVARQQTDWNDCIVQLNIAQTMEQLKYFTHYLLVWPSLLTFMSAGAFWYAGDKVKGLLLLTRFGDGVTAGKSTGDWEAPTQAVKFWPHFSGPGPIIFCKNWTNQCSFN